MSNYIVSDTSLGSVADAIRTKGGTSAPLEYPQGFIDAIDDIQTGGGDEPVPDDGKTRIWIHIAEGTPDNCLTFYLRFTAFVANNTTVDWGDGTVETLGSTTATNYPHKYAEGGDYVITMTVNSETIRFEGTSGSSGYSIYGTKNVGSGYSRIRIRKIIFGDNVTSVGDYACQYCYCVESVKFSSDVRSIGASAFFQCSGLISVIFSNKLTSIGASAFNYCTTVSEFHFKSTTPPTLSSTNPFDNIPSDCIIYVPQGSLSAYQTATNWSTYASRMQEEPT